MQEEFQLDQKQLFTHQKPEANGLFMFSFLNSEFEEQQKGSYFHIPIRTEKKEDHAEKHKSFFGPALLACLKDL